MIETFQDKCKVYFKNKVFGNQPLFNGFFCQNSYVREAFQKPSEWYKQLPMGVRKRAVGGHFSNGPDDVSRWQRATFILFIFFLFFQGTFIGSDQSCSTLIGRHKLGVVQMHVSQPLTKLWCVHLLIPAMQGVTERCRTQIF